MKTLADLGVEFKALRKQAGLTQQETARRVGTRQEALSRFERGRGSDFSVAKLLRLTQTLGCDLYFAAADRRPTLDDVLAERRAQLGGASTAYSGTSGYVGTEGYSGTPRHSGLSSSGQLPTDLSSKDAPSSRRKR